MGHSTGGLIGTYYCHQGEYRNKIDGLILNSPFLDIYDSFYLELFVKVFAYLFGYIFPKLKLREYSPIDNLSLGSINYYKDIKNRYYFDDRYFGFVTAVYLSWMKVCIYYQNYIRKNRLIFL